MIVTLNDCGPAKGMVTRVNRHRWETASCLFLLLVPEALRPGSAPSFHCVPSAAWTGRRRPSSGGIEITGCGGGGALSSPLLGSLSSAFCQQPEPLCVAGWEPELGGNRAHAGICLLPTLVSHRQPGNQAPKQGGLGPLGSLTSETALLGPHATRLRYDVRVPPALQLGPGISCSAHGASFPHLQNEWDSLAWWEACRRRQQNRTRQQTGCQQLPAVQ